MSAHTETILVVDDDQRVLEGTCRLLEQQGFPPARRATTAHEALRAAAEPGTAVLLLDLGLPDLGGEEVLARLRQNHPDIPVIVVTALVDLDTAVRCMAGGAYDYVVKGSDPGRLLASLRRALESRHKDREIAALRERVQSGTLRNPAAFADILTNSERMRVLFRFIEAVAPSDEPILLLGETGTGKELFAQAVHRASGLKGPFVATNLGGMDDFMVSDALFGHVKGAYTGADDVRKGLVVSAAGGTLFLDEIGELSPTTQVKLLRFLENREYFPLGSDTPRRSSARIVAATNRDLPSLAGQGTFRRDLLYRLSTYRIDIPPLRERREDIALLCHHFLRATDRVSETPALTSGALAFLCQQEFPGNVRELRGTLLRAQIAAVGGVLDRAHFEAFFPGKTPAASLPSTEGVADGWLPVLPQLPTIRQAVQALIQEALRRSGHNQSQAAHLLGITPQALSKRLKRQTED